MREIAKTVITDDTNAELLYSLTVDGEVITKPIRLFLDRNKPTDNDAPNLEVHVANCILAHHGHESMTTDEAHAFMMKL